MGKRKTIMEQRAYEALRMVRDVESVDAVVLVVLYNKTDCRTFTLEHEAVTKAVLMEAVQDYLPVDDDAEPDDAETEDEAEADD